MAPKFVVFIRDIPTFQRKLIWTLFVELLIEEGVYPELCYSVAQILKDPHNVTAIKTYSHKASSDEEALVKGCNVLMKKILEQALKTPAQLIIVDYISESIVEAIELGNYAIRRRCNVYFLKEKSTLEELLKSIHTVVGAIGFFLKWNQDLDEIIRMQKKDEKWHKDKNEVSLAHLRPQLSRTTSVNILQQIESDEGGVADDSSDVETTTLPSNDLLTKHTNFPQMTGGKRSKSAKMKNITMIVLKDAPVSGRSRLIDIFCEQLCEHGIAFDYLCIDELVSSKEFMDRITEIKKSLGWNLREACERFIWEVFTKGIGTRNEIEVFVLDCSDERLVDSDDYISYALKRHWEVFVVRQNSETTSIKSLMNILGFKKVADSYALKCNQYNLAFYIVSSILIA